MVVDGNIHFPERDSQAIDVITWKHTDLAQHDHIVGWVRHVPVELMGKILDVDLAAAGIRILEKLDHAFGADILNQPRPVQRRCFKRQNLQRQDVQ